MTNSYFDILIAYGDQYEKIGFRELIEVKAQSEQDIDVDLGDPEYDITRAIKKVLYSSRTITRLLESSADSWQIVGAEDRDLNTEAVEKLVKMIANLEVQSVLDPTEVSTLFDNDPVLQFTISTDKENDIQYSFAPKDDYTVLKISTSERYFKVYDWQVAELEAFTPETMLKAHEGRELVETKEISR